MAETKIDEDLQNKIMNGYRGAANLFRALVEELEARYGREAAHEIARAVVRKKGLWAGELAARTAGTGGLSNLAAAHRRNFANVEVAELSETRYGVLDHRCAIVEAWRGAGLSRERIKELADLYCWGDLAFAQAFNPEIELEFISRIAEGEPHCHWLYSLERPPESPA